MSKGRYAIRYGNGRGTEREDVGTWFTRAFDKFDALERFHDDDAGFEAYEIAFAPTDVQCHRWVWEDLTRTSLGSPA